MTDKETTSTTSNDDKPILARRSAVEIVQERIAALPNVVIQMPMCCCGRGPKRRGQRNCNLCNVEANKKHRERIKRERQAFKAMVAAIEGAR